MSGTETDLPLAAEPEAAPAPLPEPPVPFAAFAAAMRPRSMQIKRNGRTETTVTPGHADEIWLKLLQMRHGDERHTPAEWQGLIDAMRGEAVHPTDPRMT